MASAASRAFFRRRAPLTNGFRLTALSFGGYVCRPSSRSMFSSLTSFDEERETYFRNFYPITLGEVIHAKYKVVAKLGFGSASTIWCCRNLGTNKYVALKIYAHDLGAEEELDHEPAIYRHISTVGNSNHPGKMFVRTIQDSFFVTSRAGKSHQCLVHDILANDLWTLRHMRPDRAFPEEALKQFLLHLLLGLDYLHTECQIIHTDIKEANILLGLAEPLTVAQIETKEITTMSLYKNVQGYNVYHSLDFGIPTSIGRPILCNFSLARHMQMQQQQHGDIQPDPYRAPEVILEMPWGYEVDIWNVGVMIWDMFENRPLFDGLDPETGKYENRFHLASIVGLLGPPPPEFLQRSEYSPVYFDYRGNWKCVNPVPWVNWEDCQRNPKVLDREGFLNLVRKMVRWIPESRASASELLEDPWLLGDEQ